MSSLERSGPAATWTSLVSIALVTVFELASCAAPGIQARRCEFSQLHMGCKARIVVYCENHETARARDAARAAFEDIAWLDQVLSDYRSDSAVTELDENSGSGIPIGSSDDLIDVALRAREISAASDGAFDVTIGPLVELWREARRTHRLPEPSELESARALVGWRLFHVDEVAKTARLEKHRMNLDFGGIGKGYAADRGLHRLAGLGFPCAFVGVGGDIALGDPPPHLEGWTIRAQAGVGGTAEDLVLARCAVSTSGDTEQFVEIDGVRYSHIVDPRTGMALTRGVRATVIAPDGATADALATAVSVLGMHDGLALAGGMQGVEALIEERSTEGTILRDATAGFAAFVRTQSREP